MYTMNKTLALMKASRKTPIFFLQPESQFIKLAFPKLFFKNKTLSQTPIKKPKQPTGISKHYTHFQTEVVLSFNINLLNLVKASYQSKAERTRGGTLHSVWLKQRIKMLCK